MSEKHTEIYDVGTPREGGMNHTITVHADSEDFHVCFLVEDLHAKAQQYPAIEVPLSELPPIQGRNEDPLQTQKRVERVTFENPIIAFADDNGFLFAIGDGTHRLQKARESNMNTIKVHIIPARDMGDFSLDKDGERNRKDLPFAVQHSTTAAIEKLVRTPRWRKLNEEEVVKEKYELRRTAIHQEMDYARLERAFDHAELEQLSDEDWSIMSNTASHGERTKDKVIAHIATSRDHAKIFRGLENGEVLPAPIVLFQEGEAPYLIGGNTRLLACKASGVRPQILAVRV